MIDVLQQIGEKSIIQHGKLNDRIYLMKLYPPDTLHVITELSRLVSIHRYSKIICKIPASTAPYFLSEGYHIEGHVHGYYNNIEDALFVSRFFNESRAINNQDGGMRELGKLFSTTIKKKAIDNISLEYSIHRLNKGYATDMANIYTEVFKSYPFPIHDPIYLKKTIDENIQYWGAFYDGKLVALSSSEIDFVQKNAEMTDFATKQEHSGHNLSGHLLAAMELSAKKQGIRTLYTIARLNSIAMNKTFLKMEYRYSGTLVNNTEIAGCIESMNLYYKNI